LDDAPYYGAANGSLPSPKLIDQNYRAEFDVAYEEGGLYVLTMHPHYTGHRSRALWLEKLIVYIKSKPRVCVIHVKASATATRAPFGHAFGLSRLPTPKCVYCALNSSRLRCRPGIEAGWGAWAVLAPAEIRIQHVLPNMVALMEVKHNSSGGATRDWNTQCAGPKMPRRGSASARWR
jgi:hypothetical protein